MQAIRRFGKNIRETWKRYERHATTVAFLAGFIIDSLTLRRIDLWLENAVFLFYLTVAGFGIIFYNAYDGGRLQGGRGSRVLPFLPIAIQFSFGALLSGFFVFYSRSASLVRSWPFLLLLILLLVGNERFRRWHGRLLFQLSIFFFIVFSYAIFVVPVIVKSMGAHTFVASSVIGLFLTWLVARGLRRASPQRYRESRQEIVGSVSIIAAAFYLLYFLNIIPPIPLALKDIGVYHSVVRRADGDYQVTYEPVRWYELKKRFTPVFHYTSGEPAYVLSAVFAPTRLNVPVLHQWLYYDDEAQAWVPSTQVRFVVEGSRDGGYRGYSSKTALHAGKWRVDVLTERGQLIGRMGFKVEEGEAGRLEEGVR